MLSQRFSLTKEMSFHISCISCYVDECCHKGFLYNVHHRIFCFEKCLLTLVAFLVVSWSQKGFLCFEKYLPTLVAFLVQQVVVSWSVVTKVFSGENGSAPDGPT